MRLNELKQLPDNATIEQAVNYMIKNNLDIKWLKKFVETHDFSKEQEPEEAKHLIDAMVSLDELNKLENKPRDYSNCIIIDEETMSIEDIKKALGIVDASK